VGDHAGEESHPLLLRAASANLAGVLIQASNHTGESLTESPQKPVKVVMAALGGKVYWKNGTIELYECNGKTKGRSPDL
jgi:hypothetical protein